MKTLMTATIFIFSASVCVSSVFASSVHASSGDAPISIGDTNQFDCATREVQEQFPSTIKFKITSEDEIDVSATFKREVKPSEASLKRVEVPTHPRTAVFPIDGSLGISGDAKILSTKDGIKLGEVGTIVLINVTTSLSSVYQCRRIEALDSVRKASL